MLGVDAWQSTCREIEEDRADFSDAMRLAIFVRALRWALFVRLLANTLPRIRN